MRAGAGRRQRRRRSSSLLAACHVVRGHVCWYAMGALAVSANRSLRAPLHGPAQTGGLTGTRDCGFELDLAGGSGGRVPCDTARIELTRVLLF